MEFCKDLVGRADGQTDEKEIFFLAKFQTGSESKYKKMDKCTHCGKYNTVCWLDYPWY